jgi:hypothetical protein
MSFLTPLYILGALAAAAPIVFHLIRRTTRGEVPFSSLIFLSPSPPRLTRRSRLDQLLLLLLRATALVLLALAFARPFFRQAAGLTVGAAEGRRVALLVDTSASMRRGDLWARAQELAREAIDACGPGDQVAVLAFDSASRTVLSFDESAALDPARRKAVATSLVARLAPTWRCTELAQALIDAAGAIENMGDAARRASKLRCRIVLISDLQQGSRLDKLGDFEWPSDVEIELKALAAEGSNAGLQWLTGPDDSDAAERKHGLRVRVSNSALSQHESFNLAWSGDTAPPTTAYVPPGESRVVRIARPVRPEAGRVLRLQGDTQNFDNTLYLASETRESATVLYIGRDKPDDPAGLAYYLDRVFEDSPRRAVKVEVRSPTAPLVIASGRSVPLIVLAAETSSENARFLRRFAEGGGTVLVVVTASGPAPTLAALTGARTIDVEESLARGGAMLAEIAFDHPTFAPFAAPQFNDFTKIRFWKYRRIPTALLGDARVLARFERGDPAVIEKALGKGRIVILAGGWNPGDSQFARSSKFMPLMSTLLEGPGSEPDFSTNWIVGDRVPLPDGAVAIRKPDGSTARVAPGFRVFAETEEPGIYAVEAARGIREFAVNLDPTESNTIPLEVETLERFGCRMAMSGARVEAEREATRQMQNAELEGRQKLWRPMILAALLVLIFETWLAGWLGRSRSNQVETAPS